MKRKELTEEDLINGWLKKYHGVTVKQVQELHPDWRNDNPDYSSKIFYDAYPVTQEQHDEWHEWMIQAIMKHFHTGKKYAKRQSWAIYLNTAPNVKKPDKV